MITYHPGGLGGKPDTLTRRSEDLPTEGGDERLSEQEKALLKPKDLDPARLSAHPVALANPGSIPETIKQGYSRDPDLQTLRDAVKQ